MAAMKKAAVRGSRTGRPVMVLLDLLGRRWTLRIMWELRDDRALTSRALRTACDEASPTIMQARLSELREAGLPAGEGLIECTHVFYDEDPGTSSFAALRARPSSAALCSLAEAVRGKPWPRWHPRLHDVEA